MPQVPLGADRGRHFFLWNFRGDSTLQSTCPHARTPASGACRALAAGWQPHSRRAAWKCHESVALHGFHDHGRSL